MHSTIAGKAYMAELLFSKLLGLATCKHLLPYNDRDYNMLLVTIVTQYLCDENINEQSKSSRSQGNYGIPSAGGFVHSS